MKKNMFAVLETLITSLLVACTGTPAPTEGDTPTLDDPPADPAPDPACPDAPVDDAAQDGITLSLDAAREGGALFAARTAEGGVALVDLESGAVVAQAAGADPGAESDLTCDPWLSRVLVFETDAAGESGEITAHSVDRVAGSGDLPIVTLGPRDHEVWVDGVARLAASPWGALVFEDGTAGPRWRLVSRSRPTLSASGPRPAALETGVDENGDLRVTALTYGPSTDALDVRSAAADANGIHPDDLTFLDLAPPGDPPSVRWAWPESGPVLLSSKGGALVVSALDPAGFAPWVPVPGGPVIDRIEHALALPGGQTVVALGSGEVDVVAVILGDDGSPECAAGLDLPGEAQSSVLYFSRGLVPVGPGRVLAATSSGVFAVTVSEACPLTVAADPNFPGDALRGPIAPCSMLD